MRNPLVAACAPDAVAVWLLVIPAVIGAFVPTFVRGELAIPH
jgi:hypothetical protein